ncbi:SDR family NAD(P)-dependent oxidoreductase [Roseicella frigidaeris]|uniref:2,5-dichloro-2,5-cyclohexadiene-1,4-diol dehydrogenase n=1 Tax=Roseicella frigidaeris TaxID=2230885 RepID=A0A327M4N0_9PROT|nr:glucose 1-dehydrogenase [Roseicella frigidaeris]RAI58231.1 2,5-dichloro-2,5-cyclohexadiene-1,4-diol dehydrogenase [Roseicella frigidaeris]
MRMQGKVAVVTGGASGIGKRTAERFVEEGGRVVIADIQEAAAGRLCETLGAAAAAIRCDVTEEADIAAAIALAGQRWGRLDLMFNNAGRPGDPNPIETMPAAGWDDTMAVLLRSVMLGIKHAAPVMRAQGSGAIVSTASIAGLIPGSTATAYSVAKSAVIQLTKCAALELAEHGIRVNCVCPGPIATPIFGRSAALPSQLDQRVAETARAPLAGFQPIRREGRPDDIAEAVLYLADDRAGFVTGVALTVDGGFAAGMTPGERTRIWAPLRGAVAALAEDAG